MKTKPHHTYYNLLFKTLILLIVIDIDEKGRTANIYSSPFLGNLVLFKISEFDDFFIPLLTQFLQVVHGSRHVFKSSWVSKFSTVLISARGCFRFLIREHYLDQLGADHYLTSAQIRLGAKHSPSRNWKKPKANSQTPGLMIKSDSDSLAVFK